MPTLINQVASPHLADFVNAIGELKSAIFNGDFGLRVRKIAAVHIGDTRHKGLTDSERFKLAMQRRALHADELGGARDVAAEAADLRHQIFTLEHLACIA